MTFSLRVMMQVSVLVAFVLALFVTSAVPASAALVPCTGLDCDACHLVSLGNEVLKWLIGLLFVVFAAIAVSAGVKLVTSGGNTQAVSDAKSKLTNAVIGIIIVLAAWLLVDTIMKGLLSSGTGQITGYGLWSEIKCGSQATVKSAETAIDEANYTAVIQSTGVTVPNGDSSLAGTGMTHSDALAELDMSGVDVKSGAQLEGVKPHVIDNIRYLNQDLRDFCPQGSTCQPIVITEGTGGTHSSGEFSHENGFKLDLRTYDNPGLVEYVKTNFEPSGQWSDGTQTYFDADTCGTYAIEKDHIDVQYKTGC